MFLSSVMHSIDAEVSDHLIVTSCDIPNPKWQFRRFAVLYKTPGILVIKMQLLHLRIIISLSTLFSRHRGSSSICKTNTSLFNSMENMNAIHSRSIILQVCNQRQAIYAKKKFY